MICPSCGRSVADDAFMCPWCHAPLDMTRKMSLNGARWCPSCGALVAPGATECPKCGTVLPGEAPEGARRQRDLDLPEIGNTGVMDAVHDIESAIPSEEGDELGARRADRPPRTRALVLALILAVLVVGGAVLLITHPWDPQATSISATTPADTSMQGFPGFIESLTGQDASTSDQSARVSAAEALDDAHETLGKLSARVDESEELLRSEGVSGEMGADELSVALDEARAISLEVSNLISSLGDYDDGSNSTQVAELETLGSWLRNRCDALTDAWSAAVASDDVETDSAAILSGLDAARDYATRFEGAYDEWGADASASQE